MNQPWATTPPPGAGQQYWTPAEPLTTPPRPPITAAWWFWAGLAAVVVIAGGLGFVLGRTSAAPSPTEEAKASAAEASRLEIAYNACTQHDSGDTLALEDDGKSIVIDTGSEYGDATGYVCVLEELDVPTSITAQMDRTTAMMGVQEATHEGIDYSWSYHPDNGVDMVITDTGAEK